MSTIQSSRMPHAFTPVEDEDPSLRGTVSDAAKRAGDAIQGVPPLGWVLGLVGAGAVGAGIYAAFFRDTRRSRPTSRRRAPQKRQARTQANAKGNATRKPRARAAAAE